MFLDTGYLAPDRGFFTHTLAVDWPDGLLIGNGTLGAIVMGRPRKECVVVCHEELFLPLFERRPVLEMAGMVPDIRNLIRAGRGQEANRLVVEAARRAGYPEDFLMTDPFHPGFDLLVDTGPDQEVTDYRRGVDFVTGEAFVRYTDEHGGRWLERGFVSRTDGVLVMEWSCDRAFEADIRLGMRPTKMEPWEKGYSSPGAVPKGSFVQTGVRSMAVEAEDGFVTFRLAYALDAGGCEGLARLFVEGGASHVYGNGLRVQAGGRLLIVAALEPLKAGAESRLPALKTRLANLPSDYETLLVGHAARHGELFSRVRLDLAGTDAALKEWAAPGLADNYEHRHMSHLYPLYPGNEACAGRTPELYELCRRAIAMRMRHYNPAEYSAFGLYHLAMAAARTDDASTAVEALSRMCAWHIYTGMGTAHDHGPRIFNMDASGGIPAVVAEMLLQSHGVIADCRSSTDDWKTSSGPFPESAIGNHQSLLQNLRKDGRGGTRPSRNPPNPLGFANGGPASTPAAGVLQEAHQSSILLRLLPALPAAWLKGRVAGLLARGGMGVDIEWENGALKRTLLRARRDVRCRVRCGNDEASLRLAAGESARLGPRLELESEERETE
jgi:hypothetical protein